MGAVAELLSNPKRWTRGGYALDAKGHECNKPTDAKVCRWSLIAAIGACYSKDDVLPVQRKLRLALDRRGWTLPITHWNSHPERTHAEVLGLVTECDV